MNHQGIQNFLWKIVLHTIQSPMATDCTPISVALYHWDYEGCAFSYSTGDVLRQKIHNYTLISFCVLKHFLYNRHALHICIYKHIINEGVGFCLLFFPPQIYLLLFNVLKSDSVKILIGLTSSQFCIWCFILTTAKFWV